MISILQNTSGKMERLQYPHSFQISSEMSRATQTSAKLSSMDTRRTPSSRPPEESYPHSICIWKQDLSSYNSDQTSAHESTFQTTSQNKEVTSLTCERHSLTTPITTLHMLDSPKYIQYF